MSQQQNGLGNELAKAQPWPADAAAHDYTFLGLTHPPMPQFTSASQNASVDKIDFQLLASYLLDDPCAGKASDEVGASFFPEL